MGNGNVLNSYAESVASGGEGDRKKYSLDEDLAIMDMIGEGLKLPQIAKLTNRKVNSLRYRYRSKDRGIRPVFEKEGVEGVYAYHNVEFPGSSDAETRIENFRKNLSDDAVTA